jgi:hypothetical protein
MARNHGTFNFSANFEPLLKAPLDARSVVGLYTDLVDASTWKDADGLIWLYNGLIVGVANDPSSGIYFLKDAVNYNLYSSWQSVAGASFDPSTLMAYIDGSLNTLTNWQISQDASIMLLRAKDASLDASLGDYVRKSGDTMSGPLSITGGGLNVSNDVSIYGNLYVANNETIGGNLTINGSLYVVNIGSLDISTSFIKLNTGLTGAPPVSLQSGIIVERGSENPYVFVYDEDIQTFRIGIATLSSSTHYNDSSTQAVATRQDVPIANGVAVWNNTLFRFDTSNNFTFDGKTLRLDASLSLPKYAGVSNLMLVVTPDGTVTSVPVPDSSAVFTGDVSTTHVYYETFLDPSLTMPATVGGIPAGTSVFDLRGDTVTSILNDLLFPTAYPTLTAPSGSFTITPTSGSATLQEVSANISINSSASFSRGSISPQYSAASPYRSGPANNYNYSGIGLIDVSFTGSPDTQTITNYSVTLGNQAGWLSDIQYDAGVQPKDSKGNNYNSPLSAGTTSTLSRTFEGVFPIFASTVTIGVLTKQTLVSMLTGNSLTYTMVAESGGNKQQFEIPTAWTGAPTNRPLVGVQQYNTVSAQWEYPGGSAATSLLLWTTSAVTETIQTNTVNYTRYTYNGTDRSSVQIRLMF